MDKAHYLAYVAWEKINKPIWEGGLGIHNLEVMNDSLLLKLLWKVAAGVETQWKKLARAKYYPNSLLWHSKRTYNCSKLWRALMNLRPKLLPLLSWNLENGTMCSAFGQP